jgi:uncharacterized protein (DUF433 family)
MSTTNHPKLVILDGTLRRNALQPDTLVWWEDRTWTFHALVMALLARGHYLSALVPLLRIPYGCIRRAYAASGLPTRRGPKGIASAEQLACWHQRLLDGESRDHLAAEVGRPWSSIFAALRHAGYHLPRPAPKAQAYCAQHPHEASRAQRVIHPDAMTTIPHADIYQRLCDGETIWAVAEAYDVSLNDLARALTYHHYDVRGMNVPCIASRHQALHPATWARWREAHALLQQGRSLREAARAVGVTYQWLSMLARRFGYTDTVWDVRARHCRQQCDTILQMLQEHATIFDVADRVQMSPNEIMRLLRRGHVDTRALPLPRITVPPQTWEEWKVVLPLKQQGLTEAQISHLTGLTPSRVYQLVTHTFRYRPKAPRDAQHPRWQQYAEWLQAGKSVREIAEMYGVTVRSVYSNLHGRHLCVTALRTAPAPTPLWKQWYDRYQQGESIHEIAAAYGRTRAYVNSVLNMHGVKVRARRTTSA